MIAVVVAGGYLFYKYMYHPSWSIKYKTKDEVIERVLTLQPVKSKLGSNFEIIDNIREDMNHFYINDDGNKAFSFQLILRSSKSQVIEY